jgi:predicted MPP superfamily phosphohydrolase
MKLRSSRLRASPSCGSGFARFAASAVGAALAWGVFEASWVRLRVLELAIPGLPAALDGLRIVHLSDFHLGIPSPGAVAVARGVDWAAERAPDLVCITGDLLTHPRGERRLRQLIRRLPQPTFVVLGNHDYAIARDPLARPSRLRELAPAQLLVGDGAMLELRGCSVWIAGSDARRSLQRADPTALSRAADLRILLDHFPRVFDRLQRSSFDLVLAGHMHDGQIALPYPGGKFRFAHPSARYPTGVYRRDGVVMHVSPGLGTTFVPVRFGARPEATELVLVAASVG